MRHSVIQRFLATSSGAWEALPLRISLGLIFMGHGAQKLFGWFGGPGLEGTAAAFGQMGMAPGIFWGSLVGGGEFFGGLLVLLGLLTRLGALNLAVIMGVAMTQVHWGSFFLPEGIEFTLALLGSSLALLILGGGALSVDSRIPYERPA